MTNPPDQASVIRAYKRIAPFYYWIFGWALERGRVYLGREVRRLAPARVLEIGVGTGMTLRHYPCQGTIHGVDLSDEMLGHARRKAGDLPEHDIRLERMNAEALNFPDNHFDCVTLPYVLSVTPNPDKLIDEVRRVCTSDGHILVLNHFGKRGPWRWLEWIPAWIGSPAGFTTKLTLDNSIKNRDWEVEKSQNVNLLNLSCLLTIRNAKP